MCSHPSFAGCRRGSQRGIQLQLIWWPTWTLLWARGTCSLMRQGMITWMRVGTKSAGLLQQCGLLQSKLRPDRPNRRCHVMFNARYMEGTGLTYGDVPEQVWSKLVPFMGAASYMGDNRRETFVQCVVGVLAEPTFAAALEHIVATSSSTNARVCLTPWPQIEANEGKKLVTLPDVMSEMYKRAVCVEHENERFLSSSGLPLPSETYRPAGPRDSPDDVGEASQVRDERAGEGCTTGDASREVALVQLA